MVFYHGTVFPAPAGINRRGYCARAVAAGVPRASGDKPLVDDIVRNWLEVFPAPAGINRAFSTLIISSECVPRASGDKPLAEDYAALSGRCSPRQRG
ncbi:TPA: hypothetical protein H2U26_002238 [Salmonella enterica]|nr:hypothetical protein [Salmonella enterica]